MLFSNTSIVPHKNSFTRESIVDPIIESENLSLDGDLIVFQTMVESFCATYQAICCNDMSIVQEGLKDFAKSVVEFFINLAKKIGAYIKNFFNYIMSFFMDFEKFIDEYKDNIDKFKEFNTNGYDYTIDNEKILASGIDKIISGYNSNLDKIKTLKNEEVKEMVKDSLSKDELGKLRGEIVGSGGFVKPERFNELMKKKYRDGKTSTHNIKVDNSVISDYIEKFKDFKSLLEDVKDDGYKINSAFEDMATFFKDSPYYVYDNSGNKEIKTQHISGDDSGNFHVEGEQKEKYDENYFKNLNMYCNFCFRMCKSYATIYRNAYLIKTESIKEALEFYKTTIRKALNPMADKKEDEEKSSSKSSSKESFTINESNLNEQNYISQFNGMMESLEFDYYFENYESYVNELENMGKWWNNGVIMLEDVELKDRPADKDVGFFTKFIEFIKTLFAKFVDTAKNLFTSNEEWFSKYSSKLDEITSEQLAHINVTLLEYDKEEDYKNIEANLKIKVNINSPYVAADVIKRGIGNEKKEKSETYLAKKMYPEIMKLSPNDITESVKIFFRGRTNNLKTYNGDAIKSQISIMKGYCNSYNEKINDVKEIVDNLTNEMEKVQDEYDKIKESFTTYSMLEKDNIESTAYAWLPWYDSKMDDMKFPIYEHSVVIMEDINSDMKNEFIDTKNKEKDALNAELTALETKLKNETEKKKRKKLEKEIEKTKQKIQNKEEEIKNLVISLTIK